MNRSVVNVLIAAGVLSAGAVAGAAPAVADRSDAVSGSDTTDAKDAAKPQTTEPKTTEPQTTKPDATEPQTTKPDATEPDATGHRRPPRPTHSEGGRPVISPCEATWTCPWQWSRRRNNNNLFVPLIFPALPQFRSAVPAVPAVEPELDVAALVGAEAPAAPAPAPVAQSAAKPAQVVPIPTAAPAPIRLPVAPPPRPVPVAVPAPPPRSAPLNPPVTDTPPPLRVGYPEELRTADLRHLASVALPGLAALAGMTALGGLFGYRQAKAGYVLRTAGAGRFLQ